MPAGNALYLFNDADTGVVAGSPITAGGSAATLSNSQCTLSNSGGTAMLSGNNFTAPFNISFKPAFAGTHNVFGLVQTLRRDPERMDAAGELDFAVALVGKRP